jgi:membrane protein YdbS with pleckstrin-like domain
MTEIVEHVGPDGEISRLPAGERVLWTGAPDQRALARWLLRERWVMLFVLLSFSLGAADALQHTDGAIRRLIGVATLSAVLAVIAIVSVRVMAWQLERSSQYVITDRRVYFNIGIVMRADANIPYSSVEDIDLRQRPDGSGDLMITLTGAQEIPWLLLFPHMTWRGGNQRGRPTFRALREPEAAADALVGALRAYSVDARTGAAGATATVLSTAPATLPTTAPASSFAVSGAVTPSPT